MNVRKIDPPRQFEVGQGGSITISHVADIDLAADEQVTFHTEGGAQNDVARKSWGFYAAGSLNGRLPQCGLRPVLVRNPQDRLYLMLVEAGREADFEAYCRAERQDVLFWLDGSEELPF